MNTLLERDLKLHHTAMDLQAYRQQLLASNIANADTPNYKAVDLRFNDALKAALGRRNPTDLPLSITHPRHISPKGELSPEGFVNYRVELQSAVDGNTVNMDAERAAFAENSVQYEASITFINGLLRSMQSAITGS